MSARSGFALSLILGALVSGGACGGEGKNKAADASVFYDGPIEESVDANTESDANQEARFLLSWTLQGGCLGGDEVESEINSQADGRTFIQRFDCAAGMGVTELLPVGDFDIFLRVIDNDVVVPPDAGPGPGPLLALSNTSGPHTTIPGETPSVDFNFPSNTATVSSTWSFTSGRQVQTCAQAGVTNLDLEYESMSGGIERSVRVPCTSGTDPSGDLPTDLYLVRATPLDASNVPTQAQIEVAIPLFVGNVEQSASFSFTIP